MKHLYIASVAGLLIGLSACGDSQSSAPAPAAQIATNFTGQVSGAIKGQVSGPGKLKFLPTAGYDKKGYYFLADDTGIRDYGITFSFPRDIQIGRLDVTTVSPFDIGKVTSVRVDKDLGSSTHSFEKDASGYLEITSLPAPDGTGRVSGTYDVSAQDTKGKSVQVTGEFSFNVNDVKMP